MKNAKSSLLQINFSGDQIWHNKLPLPSSKSCVADSARAVLGSHVDPRIPLSQAGFDSLASVEFSQAVAAAFSITLPATLVYDYPTLDAVANYIAETAMQDASIEVSLWKT